MVDMEELALVRATIRELEGQNKEIRQRLENSDKALNDTRSKETKGLRELAISLWEELRQVEDPNDTWKFKLELVRYLVEERKVIGYKKLAAIGKAGQDPLATDAFIGSESIGSMSDCGIMHKLERSLWDRMAEQLAGVVATEYIGRSVSKEMGKLLVCNVRGNNKISPDRIDALDKLAKKSMIFEAMDLLEKIRGSNWVNKAQKMTSHIAELLCLMEDNGLSYEDLNVTYVEIMELGITAMTD